MAHRQLIAALMLLVASSCSSEGISEANDVPSASTADDDEFVASLDCGGLADRWIEIQQTYLDRLSNVDVEELRAGSARVNAASLWIGQALIEQARDSQSVGCADELVSGSTALCSRVPMLEAEGSAAAEVLAGIVDDCPKP